MVKDRGEGGADGGAKGKLTDGAPRPQDDLFFIPAGEEAATWLSAVEPHEDAPAGEWVKEEAPLPDLPPQNWLDEVDDTKDLGLDELDE